MAFTTVTGSNGVTSLVGTTGIDVAAIVTLADNVFVGGNTGDDTVTTALGTGGDNLTNYDVRMGGGDDTFTLGNSLLNSFISLDGEVLANDGNDTFTGAGELIINSEVVGRAGNDVFTNLALNGSTVNGNTGDDQIGVDGSSASFVYGGQGSDTITTTAGAANASNQVLINGNKGSDTITLLGAAFVGGSVYGGNGNDTISAAVVTNAAATALVGTTTAGVLLSGDLGADTINGSNGIDTILGGDADDTIEGEGGGDIITGGSGNQTYVYTTLTDSTVSGNAGFDTITDFKANTSAAALNGDVFDLVAGDLPANAADIITDNFAGDAGGSTNLQTALVNNVTFAATETVSLVTITGAFSYSGLYVVINAGGDAGAFDNATDSVIKVNTLANIGFDTFI